VLHSTLRRQGHHRLSQLTGSSSPIATVSSSSPSGPTRKHGTGGPRPHSTTTRRTLQVSLLKYPNTPRQNRGHRLCLLVISARRRARLFASLTATRRLLRHFGAEGENRLPISARCCQCRSYSMATTIKTDPSSEGASHRDNSSGSESKSPLAQFGFFKGLTDKKTTRDGQPPKRRGPKPDSKPALTRRQELNRQAQRTHRERKELYIKALEQEVIRLKDTFAATTRERDAFADENRRLRELLMAHGISFDHSSPGSNGMGRVDSSAYGSSTGSMSGYGPGSASTGYTSPPTRGSSSHDGMNGQALTLQQQQAQQSGHHQQHSMDYDQIGIDFVLTYDRSPYLSPPPQQ